MMQRPRTIAAAILLPSALALGACGGGVSKEDYAQDLDEVCSVIEKRTESIGQGQASNPAELSKQLDELRRTIRDGIERMRDIERPDGEDGEKAQEYVDELEQALDGELLPALEDLEQAVRAKDQTKIRAAAARLESVDEEKTDQLARDLGADDCAEG